MQGIRLIPFLLMLVLAPAVLAHNFVNSDDWCHTGITASIGQITVLDHQLAASATNGVICSIPAADMNQFDPDTSNFELLKYISPVIFISEDERQHGTLDGDGNIPGVVPGEEDYQTTVAYAYCACSSLNGDSSIDPSKARPQIITHDLTRADHHDEFKYEDGLNFSCNVCVTLQAFPQ